MQQAQRPNCKRNSKFMKLFLYLSMLFFSTVLFGQTEKHVFDANTRTEKYFHENGRVHYEIIQLDPVMDKHRHVIDYDKNGQKRKEFFDRNNVKYDTLREWTEDGKLIHLEIYTDSTFKIIDYWAGNRTYLYKRRVKII
jgi:hypothetical protein